MLTKTSYLYIDFKVFSSNIRARNFFSLITFNTHVWYHSKALGLEKLLNAFHSPMGPPKLTSEVKNWVRNFENPQIIAFSSFCLESSWEWLEPVKKLSRGPIGEWKAFNNFSKPRAFKWYQPCLLKVISEKKLRAPKLTSEVKN